MVSPGGVAELFIEVSTYDDNILNSKFDQQVYIVDCHLLYYTVNKLLAYLLQAILLLNSSVFRSQSVGVTKVVHGQACDLIAGAAHAYNCSKSTTVLALHLFDRAVALTPVRKADVTLVASTCLLIAAKLEEINVSSPFVTTCHRNSLKVLDV
jgi:hypothetical protein